MKKSATPVIKNRRLFVPHGLVISDGTIEAIKWFALVLMTFDHINKYIFEETLPGVLEMARVVMPLFAFVLAYNLARPNTLESGAYIRTMKRLGLYGTIASPFFISLGGLIAGWWPLNIMFMLLFATYIIFLIEKGGADRLFYATILFVIGGAFVEFWWFALAFCLAAWWYCKTTSKTALIVLVLATASLYVVNRNLWALASIPIILVAPLVDIKMPRIRKAFYIYYPAHLAVLLVIGTITGRHL